MALELYLYLSPVKRASRYLRSYVDSAHRLTPEEKRVTISKLEDAMNHLRSIPGYSTTNSENAVKGYMAIIEYPIGLPCLNIKCLNNEMYDNIRNYLYMYLRFEKKEKDMEFVSEFYWRSHPVEIFPLKNFYYTFPKKK